MPKKKKYVVANPRGIPKGRYIIRVEGKGVWYEGDEYDGPSVPRWIEQGFIVEVNDGEA